MSRKRNVSFIKPEDPEFLKVLKKQAGYDDKNHKFDDLQNADEDFVDDEESEKPQVVVLKTGDLTAAEAEAEQQRIDKLESEAKADLNERVIFKAKRKNTEETTKQKRNETGSKTKKEKNVKLLSFGDDEEDEDSVT